MKHRINRVTTLLALSLALTAFSAAAERTRIPQGSEAWLQKNLDDKEVAQTDSGLQYKVLRATQGCFPDARKPVTIHYEATLAPDNTVVDSSYKRGTPNTFDLKKMIKAWKEGIPMMREGEEWLFYVPPKLGYGAKGAPPLVGSDSVLVFRVELVKAGRCK